MTILEKKHELDRDAYTKAKTEFVLGYTKKVKCCMLENRRIVCEYGGGKNVASKAWQWEMVDGKSATYWKEPAVESYYLMNRWKRQGKKRFLDLGCGLGRHSIFFAKAGFAVWAFDLSGYAVAKTRAWAVAEKIEVDCVTGDMLELPYDDSSFDCILCRNVISHSDTQGVTRILAGISRIMRTGAECYLTLGSKNAWGFQQPWPVVDENTKIRLENGPENGIPHFYADKGLIETLFKDVELLSVQHIEDFSNDGGLHSFGWHWHALFCKK